jgi:phospholipid/cholesterol/gamma-HCH transport system permease protein
LAKELVVARTRFSAANTVGVVLEAVDQSNRDTLEAPTAYDVDFRFDNADPTHTKSELLAPAQSYPAAIAGTHHEFVGIWEIGTVPNVAILDVHYRRVDRRELNLRCCNVFRVSNGLARDYRIHMDVNPLIVAGGPVGMGETVGRSMRFSLVSIQVVVLAAALALYGVNPNCALTV